MIQPMLTFTRIPAITLLLVGLLGPLVTQADTTAPAGRSAATGGPAVAGSVGATAKATGPDNSSRFYTRQSESGSVVLGNGAAEDGAVPLALRAPAVVGGTSAGAAPLTNVRPAAQAVAAAVNGQQPQVNYASDAVREDLRQRDEHLAIRAAQMFHRHNGMTSAAAAGGTGP